jgi:hypothetical protein
LLPERGGEGRSTRPAEVLETGCEDKRDREIQKQIEAETKKAQEAGGKDSASKNEESEAEPAPTKRVPTPAHLKLTPGQAKQLVKLIDLYLSEHPEAGSKRLEVVHADLTLVR